MKGPNLADSRVPALKCRGIHPANPDVYGCGRRNVNYIPRPPPTAIDRYNREMKPRTIHWLIWLFALLLIPVVTVDDRVFSDEEAPPTPAERIAGMKADCAKERAKLGTWAAGKKLGSAAKAQFLLAIRLDPDCSRARQRLGHRKDPAGGWKTDRAKEWEYGRGAMEKHGKDLTDREAEVLAKETRAFEELGAELIAEGETGLGRALCLRAHLLSPELQKAAEGAGLEKFAHGWVTPEMSKALRDIPEVERLDMRGTLGGALDINTVIRRCGAATAETVGSASAAEELARLGHRATLLVTKRFGIPTRPPGWVQLIVASTQSQFQSFLDRSGAFQEPMLSTLKALGTARAYSPRHFSSSFCGGVGDPLICAELFIHAAAEDVLIFEIGVESPAWLSEAVGVDANLILRGAPGPLCLVYEQSTGLNMKEMLENPADWPRALLRQAILGTLPHLNLLIRAQYQALSPEDVVAAREYYRYLLLTHREGLGAYLKKHGEGLDPEKAFAEAFGISAEAAEAEFVRALTGE